MLDWLADHLALIMFGAMFVFIFLGYPVAFIMGGMALLFAAAGASLGVFKMIGLADIVSRMWAGVAADPVLASILARHYDLPKGAIEAKLRSAARNGLVEQVKGGGWLAV